MSDPKLDDDRRRDVSRLEEARSKMGDLRESLHQNRLAEVELRLSVRRLNQSTARYQERLDGQSG